MENHWHSWLNTCCYTCGILGIDYTHSNIYCGAKNIPHGMYWTWTRTKLQQRMLLLISTGSFMRARRSFVTNNQTWWLFDCVKFADIYDFRDWFTRYELFFLRGIPEQIRSDNGPEFTEKAMRKWWNRVGVKALFIEPGSLWENGYAESFNVDRQR